ncbi:hypothetical protein EEL32_06955 [Brevibacillus laterosporus]|nr:hypothetical protein [Brevibacillus laterosporus]TPG89187.1 hypothetical protein EEL32_06955 [Brevibacillus laterosporus]
MKKYMALLVALFVVIGLTVFGANEKTDASIEKTDISIDSPKSEMKQEEVKSTSAFKDMTTEEYLSRYNKLKKELASKGIEVLPFTLELEKNSNFYRFYYPKKEKYTKEEAKWVSVMLKRDGKTIDGLMYKGTPDLHTIKAMIQATGIAWSDQLDQLIKGGSTAESFKEMKVDGVKISIKRESSGITVMVDPERLDSPKKL